MPRAVQPPARPTSSSGQAPLGTSNRSSSHPMERPSISSAFRCPSMERPPDGGVVDAFGSAVSLSGDTVVVGAPRHTTPSGFEAGGAYVFVRSGTIWSQQQKLVASDGGDDDRLGTAVSISGDT